MMIGLNAICQDELTPEEIKYRDSIANLNETNEAIQMAKMYPHNKL